MYQAGGAVYIAGVYAAEGWGVLRSYGLGCHVEAHGSQRRSNGRVRNAEPRYVMAAPFGDNHYAERSDAAGTTWATWSVDVGDGPSAPRSATTALTTSSWPALGEREFFAYVEP